jgi:hypothetical protein
MPSGDLCVNSSDAIQVSLALAGRGAFTNREIVSGDLLRVWSTHQEGIILRRRGTTVSCAMRQPKEVLCVRCALPRRLKSTFREGEEGAAGPASCTAHPFREVRST